MARLRLFPIRVIINDMNANHLLLLNFEEIRRRSIKVWQSIPAEKLEWKPDDTAMTCLEMMRHVLEAEYLYTQIINARGSLKESSSPFELRPLVSLEDELNFAKPYRKTFLEQVQNFSVNDLETIQIDRSDVGYVRPLGDFLLRVGYHEAVHCGQLLGYLRMTDLERPEIWD
jgi:uncharacterized damage-inducible protein DinB